MSGMELFAALMLMGARVREVDDLEEGHLWLPDVPMLIVDRDLPLETRGRLNAVLLPKMAEISV